MQYREEERDRRITQLKKGILELAVMGALYHEPHYGYSLVRVLTEDGSVSLKEGTIYPVLRALAAAGLLTSRVVPSYAGPARRYYRITEEGRATLLQWTAIWRQTRGFVDRFIEGTNS